MSAVTKQPLPCGHLEREKHIETFFRAFHGRSRPLRNPQGSPGAGPRREPPGWEGEDDLSGLGPGRPRENGIGLQQRSRQNEEDEDGLQMDSMAALESASLLHVTARPDLQGKHIRFDRQGQRVFHLERPLRVDACCLGCCLMEMRAYTPQNRLLGTVRQRWSMFTPLLEVCDSEGILLTRILGSCCPSRCAATQEFQTSRSVVPNIKFVGELSGAEKAWLRTRRRVSRMRAVVAWSLAVLFQMEMMSSWGGIAPPRAYESRTWNRTDTTAPQISSPTMNCSPSMARIRFSQQRDARPFLSRMIHFPPILWKSLWPLWVLAGLPGVRLEYQNE
ncbi:hypothetical protein CRUP_015891 [Coryphaenoides rupestris]|nr:hypothetical protein CRUP_015891 [Coryphaenoides rupestris]